MSRKFRSQLQLFEQALSLTEDGALSGFLANALVAPDSATALLRGIQNELGISVINSATFGALSEREMQMAMATNLNLKLPPDELREMILEQIRVRTKLAQDFEAMAERLLVGEDRTWSDFVEYMIEESARHDAVVWEQLRPDEIEKLLASGIDREAYKDTDYTWRRKFFDARDK